MIDILCSQLPATFCEIDQLAAILLRFCRDHVEHLRQAYDRDDVCGLMYEESDRIQVWLESLDEDWLDEDELVMVARSLRRAAEMAQRYVPAEQAATIAARAFAEALDRSHGRRFAGVFRGRGATMAGPGDPIPILHPPLKELFGSALGTNPARLGPQLHELEWLRLVPEVARGHQVRIDFQHADVLADLSRHERIAVIIPSDVLADLRFERTSEPMPRFFGVRPARPEEQTRIVLEMLDEVAAKGARIAILPELCLDPDGVAAVREWHARAKSSISLLVCGSVHTERDGRRRNVSPTLLADGTIIEHFKFNPFYLPLPPPEGGSPINHREDIVTTPSVIAIHMCADWSFTTLLCKDFLESGVAQILEEAMVRLVLVPSCSPKTSVFEQIAGLLATRAQAIVVIANLADPSHLNPSSVILARPTHTGTLEQIRRSQVAIPCLHFLSISEGHELDG